MLSSRSDRAGRGVLAAVIATCAAAASHSLADGRPAPLLGVLLALVFALPLCVGLAGRRPSWLRLSVAVGLSQFAFHGLLLLGLGGGAFSFAGSPSQHAAHASGLVAPSTSGAIAPHVAHEPVMWLAHACAAAVTVLALGAGERALVALLGLARLSRVDALFSWRSAEAPPSRAVSHTRETPMLLLALLTSVLRRGPPRTA
ncbi:hypothetical protein [Leucobacter sp. USHLN153]|uniref:hypothetical protein n=1 Tax=Leucobacter sp. USHLN153 TaxID=3081268 RepID=UPI003019CB18